MCRQITQNVLPLICGQEFFRLADIFRHFGNRNHLIIVIHWISSGEFKLGGLRTCIGAKTGAFSAIQFVVRFHGFGEPFLQLPRAFKSQLLPALKIEEAAV
jgi:hypothetical protein